MNVSRRRFVQSSGVAGTALAMPTILSSGCRSLFAPSKRIQVGVIGNGRIANDMDIPGLLQNADLAALVAVSDCDAKRMRATVLQNKKRFKDVLTTEPKQYQDYHELLADPAVDAVMICVPDFWHAQLAIEAALAGKDVYVQKPLAMTVTEGRAIVEIMKKTGRVFHIGSQQRSEGKGTFGPQFRQACEYVRDGRLGKILRVEIGLPQDPKEPTDWPLTQPVPATFDFSRWLGCTPDAPYSELRTHPQGKGDEADLTGRPGWMTIQNYDMGMIANWGAHHIDIAQWGLGKEDTGPVKISGTAEFPKRRLWDVHGKMNVEMTYADGTLLHVTGTDVYPCGVRFIGENGWIFCSRGAAKATASDPGAGGKNGQWRALEASKESLIQGEVKHRLVRNLNHHRVWLESIRSRKPTNILPESAHRSTTACILGYTAMNLKRTLTWDPAAERFVNDDEANATLARPERAPYGVRNALKKANITL